MAISIQTQLDDDQILNVSRISHRRKQMERAVIYHDFLDRIANEKGNLLYLALELIKEKDLKTNRVIYSTSAEDRSKQNAFYVKSKKLIELGFMKRVSNNVYMINPEASPTYTKTYDQVWEEYNNLK